MITNILIFILSTFSFLFFIAYIITVIKLKKILKDFAKLSIDNAVMQEYIDIVQSNNQHTISDELVDKENFIKFLSNSRDWAFKYIEDVQEGLLTFVNGIEPEISYFDEYGEVGSAYPHYHSMKKISQEYRELKKLLPVEGEQ
jgi:hypothetical protein